MNEQADYPTLLAQTQQYISSRYAGLFGLKNQEERKRRMLLYIRQFFLEQGRPSEEGLMERLYLDMAEFACFTPYLNDPEIEELNLNCWNDGKVTYSDGRIESILIDFDEAEDVTNIVRRMLRVSGKTVDKSHPIIRTHMGTGKRISATYGDILKTDDHISFSMRFVNPRRLEGADFLANGTATGEMLDFLIAMYRYGISICCAGATGSGKTTLISYVVSQMPDNKRIFSIEDSNQEFDFRKYDEEGHILNNVVHAVTRESDNEEYTVTMADLVVQALTYNPYYLVIGEMKTADAARRILEAANTGHAVFTTVHANSCAAIYYRMMCLCANGDVDSRLLYAMGVEAFPLVLYMTQLEDNSRRVTEIAEAVSLPDGKKELRTLYRFNVEEDTEGGGHFEKVFTISPSLQRRLKQQGMPVQLLNRFLEGGKSHDSLTDHRLSADGICDLSYL